MCLPPFKNWSSPRLDTRLYPNGFVLAPLQHNVTLENKTFSTYMYISTHLTKIARHSLSMFSSELVLSFLLSYQGIVSALFHSFNNSMLLKVECYKPILNKLVKLFKFLITCTLTDRWFQSWHVQEEVTLKGLVHAESH